MNWHYVYQGQQAGPVTEEELLTLVREGKLSEETLVWREGMPNWIAFHQAGLPTASAAPQAPPLIPPAPLNPNEVVCVECRRIFPIDETIPHGNVRVCAGCKPVFLQKLAEGARLNSAELEYAGFWIRFAAKLIDGLILGVPVGVIFAVTMMSGGISSTPGRPPTAANIFGPFLLMFLRVGVLALKVGYEIFFLGKYGATPGKMVCKLQAVSSDGTRFTYGRATGRAFAEILSAWTCYIGYLIVVFDGQKRALHDHICNTRVVIVRK
jgi:uncharacterized RDD family membrane protein YckC